MLNNKIKYIIGVISSQFGSSIQSVVIPLLILDITKSGTIMSLFFTASMISKMVSYPIAGIVCDKYNKKKILIAMDIISGSFILMCALLAYTDRLNLEILFIMQITVAFVSGIFQTTSSSIVPIIISKEELLHVNTIKNLAINGIYIIGPVIGGFLYGVFNVGLIFLINGLSFLVSAIIEIFIVYNPKKLSNSNKKQVDENNFKSYYTLIKSLINSEKQIGYIVLLILILNVLMSPLFSCLYPVYYRQELNFTAFQYGFVESSLTLGLLFTSYILLKTFNLNKISNINKYIFIGITLYGIGVVSSGVLYSINFIDLKLMFILQLIAMFIIGIGAPIFDICIDTYIQEKCDESKLGKVFAFLDFIGGLLAPLSIFLFGLGLSIISSYILIALCGIGLLLVSLFHKVISSKI